MSSFLPLILIAIVIGLGITTLLVALISQLTDPAARPPSRTEKTPIDFPKVSLAQPDPATSAASQ